MFSHPDDTDKQPVSGNDRNMKNIISGNIDTTSATSNMKVGCGVAGGIQDWKTFVVGLGKHQVEHLISQLEREGRVQQAYELKQYFERLNPIKVNPELYQSQPELFITVTNHARRWQRLTEGTIDHRMRCARRMARHPVFPINFGRLSYEQFIAYMQYREDNEAATHDALRHDLQTTQMFLKAYGVDPSTWFYRLPPAPSHKERILPMPDMVHRIINHDYTKDPYANALYQHLFAHCFWIGWRVPSEPAIMTLSNIDFDTGYIIIKERKKHNSTRQIFPESAILTGKTRKSLKNWVDKWRPKAVTQYSGDYLYIEPRTGKPFNIRYLGHWMSRAGKKVYPLYEPYVSRHWCAVARLINTKLENGSYDPYVVKNWLGHEKIATTEIYVQHAERYYRVAPYNWINCTLKFNDFYFDNGIEKDSAENRNIGQKPTFRLEFLREGKNGPEEIWMCLLREFPVETNRKNDGFDFTVNSLKTFCETEFNGLTFFFSIPTLHSESVSFVSPAIGDRWCCEGY